MPPGLAARLAGIPWCPQAGIERAASRTGPHGGAEELADPSCPAASAIGRTLAAAGVGSELTYVPGSLYLAGPYHGDPLSVVAITPAVAGPFDAGTVVVRQALTVNPIDARAEVDGAASDPIPHILKGIPLNVREIRVFADRPGFAFNPTNCTALATQATLWGAGTALAPAGESPVGALAPYRAVNCAGLGFKPKLAIKLKGGTKRGKFPALRAVVTPREGDANFSRAAVTLPHSEFLEQGHFGTICTRVQFAAAGGNGEACPPGAAYGHVKVFTPILAEPAEGNVYLRSSDHNLPDLVIALQGPPSAAVKLQLVARIDSVRGGIRTSFEATPDLPFSRLILDMRGGQQGPDRQLDRRLQGKAPRKRQPRRPERADRAHPPGGALCELQEAPRQEEEGFQALPQAPRLIAPVQRRRRPSPQSAPRPPRSGGRRGSVGAVGSRAGRALK